METIGTAVARIMEPETASLALSVERPRSLVPASLKDCRQIAAWAEATLPQKVPASAARILKRLEHLEAMFPRKSQDEHGGELRATGYVALLMGQTDEALSFMVREACKRHDWFPTIKQLLAILAEYQPPMPEQEVALIACRNFGHAAFERWLVNVRGGQPIGDVSDQWKRIAVEQGVLRKVGDDYERR